MIRSNEVDNMTVNTYTVKGEDGTRMVEQINKDKDTGAVSRIVDGKEVVDEVKQDTQIHYAQGNGEGMMIILLNDIKRQLVEMNYYMAKVAKEDKQ